MENNNTTNEQHEFKPIATKISIPAAQMLDAICKKNGITLYELLQTICDCAIRYMSDQHRLSADLQRVMEMFFEDLNKSTFRISDYTQDPAIIEAIFILGDHNRQGNRSVLVKEPFFGVAEEDWNAVHIFEEFICKTDPKLYRRIRIIGSQMEKETALDVIDTLCRQSIADDPTERDVRAMFGDDSRSESGREAASAPYVRHYNRGADFNSR